MRKNDINIEELVKQSEGIENALLTEALADLKAKERENQKKGLIAGLRLVQKRTAQRVEGLRNVRKLEKESREALRLTAQAEQEFLKTGDIEIYAKTLFPKDSQNHERIQVVRDFEYAKNQAL